MHSVTDRQTDGRTDGQQAAANSRSYCVAVRSANESRQSNVTDCSACGTICAQNRYAGRLTVVRLGLKNYLDVIERAVSLGETVLIENIEESVDPVLDPIIGRNTIKKGRAVKMGDKEVEYNPEFRLILHTKLANPHYKPEMQVSRFCAVFLLKHFYFSHY